MSQQKYEQCLQHVHALIPHKLPLLEANTPLIHLNWITKLETVDCTLGGMELTRPMLD